jgi:hypothetical protein
MKKIKANVVQQENEEPVVVEIIAQSIKKIADAVDKMSASGLSQRAILVLLRDASGENMRSIQNILKGMRQLRELYLRD